MAFDQYEILAEYYDKFNSGVDYASWADFFTECVKRYAKTTPVIVLDAACGTGKLTFLLEKKGFDMIGVDASEQMLGIAVENARKIKSSALFLRQDLCELDLYGTVDAAVCSLDSLNYLTSFKKLKDALSKIAFFMTDGGLFVFDINTKYKFEKIYADNSYVYEDEKVFCVWQNSYNKDRNVCDFYLTFFRENEDGTYTRMDEIQREKYPAWLGSLQIPGCRQPY